MKQLYSTALAALLTTGVSVGAMAAAQVVPAPAAPAPSSSTIGNDMIVPLTTPAKTSNRDAAFEEAIKIGLDPAAAARQQALYEEALKTGLDPAAAARQQALYEEAIKTGLDPKKPGTKKPRPVPRDTDYQEYLRAEEQQKKEPRKTILVRRTRIDPCGDSLFNIKGEVICKPREVAYHEVRYVGDPDENEQRDHATKSPPISSAPRPSGFPVPSSGTGSSANSGGGSAPGGATGGVSTGAGRGGGSAGTGEATGGGASGGAGSTAGSTPVDTAGFQSVGRFGVRIDSVRIDGDHLDVRVTLRADPGATRLVGNGDWFANAADADGVGMESTAIWRPTDGKPQPFDLMPRIPGGQSAQVRFMIPLEAGYAGIARVSIRDLSGNVATFDLPGRSDLAATTAAVERAQATPVTIGDFAVTIDRVSSWVDQKAELVFSARNLGKQRRFLGGTRLVFRARRQSGDMIEATGRTYLARGRIGRAVEMAAVEAGATAQMRMIFDTPTIIGPVNVSDGTAWVTATMPPTAEPAW